MNTLRNLLCAALLAVPVSTDCGVAQTPATPLRLVEGRTVVELERVFANRVVEEVAFQSSLNLDSTDLSSALAIRPGERIVPGVLQRSVTGLLNRQIFTHVDVQVVPLRAGGDAPVRVELLLTPVLSVGELLFRGNETVDGAELRRAAGVRVGSEAKVQALREAADRVRKTYYDNGFFQAQVALEVIPRSQYSQVSALFRIDEGERYTVGKVLAEGEVPPMLAQRWSDLQERVEGRPATKEELRSVVMRFLALLRSEGYLQASVLVRKRELVGTTVQLTVKVTPRTPLTISFVGNRELSAEELLEPLQLETRTVPFSPNAIGSLCKEIEALYQRNGYFFADTAFALTDERDGRRFYTITIQEGQRISLDSLVVLGNTRFSDRELEALLVTKPAGPFLTKRWFPGHLVQSDLAEDLARIEDFYERRGYPGTKASFDMELNKGGDSAKLSILVTEASRVQLDAVQVIGVPPGSALPVEVQRSAILPGGERDESRIAEEERRLRSELFVLGYPNSSVTTVVEGGSVRFEIETGVKVLVGKIIVQGNKVTHDHVILKEIRLQEGATWNPASLEAASERLLRTGLFAGVTLQPADGVLDGAVEDLAVTVEERDTGTFNLETTFNTEDGLHLNGEVTQRNFRGEGDSITLGVDGFYRSGERFLDAGRARAMYGERAFLGTDLRFIAEGFAQYSIALFEEYRYNRIGFGTSLQREISPQTRGDLGLSVYTENVYNVPEDLVIGQDDLGVTFYSLLRGSMQYDRRDDRFNPRRGVLLGMQSEVSSALIGSEVNFWGLTTQTLGYYPLSSKVFLTSGARLSLYRPFSDTDVIPLSSRVFLGGRSSLRGFSRGAVGPRSKEGGIVGGDTGVNFSTEVQREVTSSVAGVVFLDMGQSVLANEGEFGGDNSDLWSLRYSPGVGLRYKTPIGPLSLDWGFALDREYGERYGRVTFGIGGVFY